MIASRGLPVITRSGHATAVAPVGVMEPTANLVADGRFAYIDVGREMLRPM